jgi:hypothetical protein
MGALLSIFVSGLVFALGLGVSGMTDADKVIGFLNVGGDWDPSLAFVMVGAIAVHMLLLRLVLKRPSPIFGATFRIPTRRDIDKRLIGGAALFGAGWGLGGFCPGPGIVSSVWAQGEALVFVGAMTIGMASFHVLDAAFEERRSRHA